MASNDKTVNVTADANATSIQITINLGKPAEGAAPLQSDSPKGVFVRHAFSDPGPNPVKKVRLSFIPDDAAQNPSSNTFDANLAEPTKWRELLGVAVGFDIDAGVIVLRMNESGNLITWLPENTALNPIIKLVKQKTAAEPGGVSIGDFIGCWNTNGSDAAAAAHCLDQF